MLKEVFNEQWLYRVEIIKPCPRIQSIFDFLWVDKNYIPSLDSVKLGLVGSIPTGIKGWVIKKWSRLLFLPDAKQAGFNLIHSYIII